MQIDLVGVAIGLGGLATRQFIEQEILTRFRSPRLSELEDSASVDLSSPEVAITTDSFIVNPPIFPGGDIGCLAVSGICNDLVASGAKPKWATLGLIVSAQYSRASLIEVLDSLAVTAANVNLEIVAGDTKVTESRSDLMIAICMTGLGELVRSRRFRLADAQPGDSIIITGTIGDHSLAVLSAREGLGFEHTLRSDCAPLNDLLLPLFNCQGVHSMRDPTRGGVLGVLHDLASATNATIRLFDDELPIRRDVRACSEMLGLDPLELVNEGKMILAVDPSFTKHVLAQLQRHPLGVNACAIGEIVKPSGAPCVTLRTQRGERVLDLREGAVIPRLC